MMNRKKIIVLLLLLVFVAAAWLFVRTSAKITQKQQLEASIQTLPNISVLGLDSTQINIKQSFSNSPIGAAAVAGRGAVFYFDPDCEHCQAEAQALSRQVKAFENTKLWWLSVASLAKLRAFERKYALQKIFGQNLKIAQLSNEQADKVFGFRVVPTILIYDSQQKLVKKYVGQTKIETLIK